MKEKTPIPPVPLDRIPDVGALVGAFGGPTRLGRDAGIPVPAVKMWRHRGSIPIRYWPAIIALAVRHGFQGVDANWLVRLHDRRKAGDPP